MKTSTSYLFLRVDKRGGVIGASIAAFVLAVCSIWYSWEMGVLFAVMFLLTGFVRIQPRHPLSQFLLNALWGVLCIFVSCLLPTLMVTDSSYLNIGFYRIVMNFLCVAVVYGVCLTFAGTIKSAVAVASGLLMIMATANTFLFAFRGNELKPMDFLSLRTALNVADQYVFKIEPRMLYSWLLWLWMMFCLGSLPPDRCPILPKNGLRLAAAAATVICAVLLCFNTKNVRTKTWSNQGTDINGYFLNFYTGIRDCFVQKPEGYSAEAVDELASEYAAPEASAAKSMPNILVIMNESFVDFEVLGSELRTNMPVTPFVDSLQENTIRGYALASVFGGGTANSEFEFLTGSSMAYLPMGSVAYQQYINGEIFSLAWLMNAYGYQSITTHPYLSSGWNRTVVYPYLGFSESTFLEAYPQKNMLRNYVSDREMYEYVLNVLEEPSEKPLFLFGITMQNHGDYIYSGDNYRQTIYLDGYAMEHPMAEQYLTLLHESDEAVKFLLSELEEYPEDIVVLFFGDHFPNVGGGFLQEMHGGQFETLSEKMQQYQVPFFIWANYDIPEQTVECTSFNYLGRYLLEAAGLELPPYFRFLKDLEEVIPAINSMGYYSTSQQTFLTLEEAEGEEAQWLNRYAMVQYNNLFDPNNRSSLFFP